MTETMSKRIARETEIDEGTVSTVLAAAPVRLSVSESELSAALRLQDGKRTGTPHSYVRGVLDTLGIPVNEESMELPSRAGAKFLAYPRGNTRHQGERTLVIAGKQCIDIDSGERHSPDLFSGNYPAWIVTAVIDWG